MYAFPEGLEVLHWNCKAHLELGVLPNSLQVMMLTLWPTTRVAKGALPARLKCLGLPKEFVGRGNEMGVPTSVKVVWGKYQ